jgi:sphingosine kinase
MRRYHGRVQFVPAPGYESFGEALQHNSDCKAAIGISGLGQGNDAPVQQGGYQGPSICSDSLEWRFLELLSVPVLFFCKEIHGR